MHSGKLLLSFGCLQLLLLAACGYDDRAIFVTNTSVGIDADAATQKVGIGYDRTEIFTGPV